MIPRPGSTLTLTCDTLDDNGAGVCKADDLRLHVAGALPGEKVSATIEHVSPHRTGAKSSAWGRLATVVIASPDRVTPACPAFASCGGCVLQHLAYPAQVARKRGQVLDALARAGLDAVPVAACVPSPRPLGYRNQGRYVAGRDGAGKLVLGAYAPRSHRLVDLAGCRVVEPVIDDVARVVRDLAEERGVPPFDEVHRTGLLRYVLLRSNAAGAVLATLVTARPDLPAGDEWARELRRRAPAVAGVVHNVNPTTGNVLLGHEERLLDGSSTIDDAIGEVRVRLSSRSFFQLNRDVGALVYQAIRAAAAPLGRLHRVVDAYSGVGGIALHLANFADEVVGIEAQPAAALDAAAAAQPSGPGQLRFLTGDAAVRLAEIDAADLLVLNPPRAGCAPAVLEHAARLRPRLIAYLSCNLDTLVRDLTMLMAPAGPGRDTFNVSSVTPFDMLPHTPHVEALALITAPTLWRG